MPREPVINLLRAVLDCFIDNDLEPHWWCRFTNACAVLCAWWHKE